MIHWPNLKNNAKYFCYDDDVRITAELFEEWKEWKKEEVLEK